MENVGFQTNTRPRVVLLSGPSSTGTSLLDNLLSNYCQVFIVSNDENLWRQKTFYLKENKFYSINANLPSGEFSYYVIDFNSLITLSKWKNILETIYKKALVKSAKIVLIAPLILESLNQKSDLKFVKEFFATYDLFSLILIGEIFGPRMEQEESFVSKIIYESLLRREYKLYPTDFYVYPTFSPFLAKKLVKEVFSFSNPKEDVLFLSSQIKYSEMVETLKDFLPEITSIQSKEGLSREVHAFKKRYLIEVNLKNALSETFDWFRQFPPKIIPIQKKEVPVKKVELPILPKLPSKKRSHNFKPIGRFLFLPVFILLTPLILLLISLITFYVSVNRVKVGDLSSAKLFLKASQSVSMLAYEENLVFTSVPVVGRVFIPQQNATSLFISLEHVSLDGISILEDSSSILENVLKKKSYDLAGVSSSLGVRVDTLYKDLSFLEGDFVGKSFFNPLTTNILEAKKFSEMRQKILLSKNIFYELPKLLGLDKKVTYLLLFQNNMELRPTGGFIGSFALITFEKGNLTLFEVHDVYEADGTLKGHVDPPEPIRKYLGEGGWYLRDSNWDSDFPTSAAKAEWFLGKELNKQVDGVIAIDLNVVSEVLKATGPIYLSDYNKEINSTNLYNEVQSEAEENFFPGSQQKRNILTVLSRQLIERLSQADSKDNLKVGKALYQSLKEKHILVFLHNRPSAEALGDMGFDGAVKLASCSENNCYADSTGVVEANLGVNKENYFLKRSISESIDLSHDQIRRSLTLNYSNADNSQKENNSYKTYVRVLMAKDSAVESLTINGNLLDSFDSVDVQGRKEVGFWTEIPALGKSTIVIIWKNSINLDLARSGVYKFYFRKQPGTSNDFVSFSIKSEVPLTFDAAKGVPFLTKAGEYVYNMLLAEDLMAVAAWK